MHNATESKTAAGETPTLRPRPDIRVFARTDGYTVIEDPVEGKHYRLGPAEYRFITYLGNSGDLASAHAAVCKVQPKWTSESSHQLVSWLYARRLIQLGEPTAEQRPMSARSHRTADPLFLKIPLGSAEHFTKRLVSLIEPWAGVYLIYLALAIVLIAVIGLTMRWHEFSAAYSGLMTPTGIVTLAVSGFGLKILHEIGHCVACRRYGGRVDEFGVLFACGMPLPFVDVSSSRRFPSRLARINVALAGVAVECLVTAAAVVLALCLGTSVGYYVAGHLVLTFAFATIAFNLNPLMRYDGYFVLVELLRADNLYQRGAEFVASLRSRVVHGSVTTPRKFSFLESAYGLASFIWRVLVLASLGVLVISALHGVGLMLVAWSAWRMWGAQAFKSFGQENVGDSQPNWSNTRRLGIVAIGFGTCIVVAYFVPLPVPSKTFATVEYDPPSIIHCPRDAFVEAVHVHDNQSVKAGDLLLTLRSRTIAERLLEAELACQQLELEVRTARSHSQMGELKRAEARLEAASRRLRQARNDAQLLEIRSSVAGTISGKNLENLVGAYLKEGTEIAAVGREDNKRLRIMAGSGVVDQLAIGTGVRYQSYAGQSGIATVEATEPRSTRTADGSSLGAHMGGPLEVTSDDKGNIEFIDSLTPVIACLDATRSDQLLVGQRVYISIGSKHTIYDLLRRAFRGKGERDNS